jgi:hypothetical protein
MTNEEHHANLLLTKPVNMHMKGAKIPASFTMCTDIISTSH